MSDYMFMLESHLTGEQSRVLAEVRQAAEQAGVNLFLTGGAMRDMMGGFPIRDLDFTVEGPALKLGKALAQSHNAEIVSTDDLRKSIELKFPGNVTVSLSMARDERYSKPGTRPHVQSATIHEDLRCRDFTVNAIAMSLGKASRGLLLDPMNGLGDISAKELRAITNHTLYDDPSRLLRLVRLRVRLGFAVSERTLSQYHNVLETGLQSKISEQALRHEMREAAVDPSLADILAALDESKLVTLLSPALTGPKLNLPAFQKLQKARLLLPAETAQSVDWLVLFALLLAEKLTPKERGPVVSALGLTREQADQVARFDTKLKKVERDLAALRVTRPSTLYNALSGVQPELAVLLLVRSTQRVVLDRVKNYFQKYLPLAQEVSDKEILDKGVEPGSAKYQKLRAELIKAKLDARPKKVPIEEPPAPPPAPSGPVSRRSASFARS